MTETISDAAELEAALHADDFATSSVDQSPPPANPVAGDAIEPLGIEIRKRFGYRNVRGKPTRVPTGHLDILVDGRMHAFTRERAGRPIYALAEFLPREIPQLVSAVQRYTDEDSPREFKTNTTPTQSQIDKLNGR